MDFNDIKKKAQDLVGQHGDKIEQGLDKAGEFAKDKFGHGDKVDQALDKAKGFLDDNRGEQKPDEGRPQN